MDWTAINAAINPTRRKVFCITIPPKYNTGGYPPVQSLTAP
jgi:hypothetical protein